MASPRVAITPKRNLALFAALSVLMVGNSYLLMLLLAAARVYLPYLALTNATSMQFQLFLLFLGGIAVAGAMLWSLVPHPPAKQLPQSGATTGARNWCAAPGQRVAIVSRAGPREVRTWKRNSGRVRSGIWGRGRKDFA